MAILENEVCVGINNKNAKYFTDIGYDIPRRKDVNGQLRIATGTKILVKIHDLSKGSGSRITKICDDCGKHIPNQQYGEMIRQREKGDGKDRCHKCSRVIGGIKQKSNIKYENSLEVFAKLNNMVYLLEEFSDKNEKRPNEITYGSGDKYWWNCPDCKSEYDMKVGSRTCEKCNCPYCSRQRVNHTNCLWTTHPQVAKLLVDKQRGYKITYGSNKKEHFLCDNCGFIDKKIIHKVVEKGFSCPKCSDGISYPEKLMINLLSQVNIHFETQKLFDWSDNKRYDFFLPEQNCIIETHGGQHYNKGFETCGGRNLVEEQENDILKEKSAKENGIEKYIVIDCRHSDFKFIKNNIIKSEIVKLFDLNHVNWDICNEFAYNSLVKKSCELWSSGIKSTNEIGELLSLSNDTIRKYLKQGTLLGWCDYDPKEVMREISSINGKRGTKKIIQLSKDREYIKTWNSIKEAQSNLKIKTISIACSGKIKTAGGFKWMYKEDYDRYIKQAN